jgi:NADH-quinone oxidoreductase subunit D
MPSIQTLSNAGSPRTFRTRTRSPSLSNSQAMAKLLEGHMLADGVTMLGSLSIVAGELDRCAAAR